MADWTAAPSTARWYGEVVAERPLPIPGGTETDYFYGYSNDDDPDVRELVPEGWDLLQARLDRARGAEEHPPPAVPAAVVAAIHRLVEDVADSEEDRLLVQEWLDGYPHTGGSPTDG